ncbi:MAG: 5'-methylthioadenosine/adenosylhomocysteine nucleosidase [Bacteroidaceae bacterium]|nr:5'-methylthioadenosine/adenosylhomocysteine nucleosidase [Bacteroidaceae bacterium]
MVIAVIVAMQKEMASLSALLHNRKEETINGFKYITGELGTKMLILHQCGIGKVNAAVGASELIRNFQPDYLISSGCAGGLESKLKVMEVIASTSTVYHDIFVGEAGEGLDIEKPYPSDTYLINKVKELIKSSTTVIHQGQICTGDQFVTERAKLESIKQRFPEALAVDMESCAIAHTCKIYGIPFISFRIISDTIDSDLHIEEYKNFWAEMADQSFCVVKSYLESL